VQWSLLNQAKTGYVLADLRKILPFTLNCVCAVFLFGGLEERVWGGHTISLICKWVSKINTHQLLQ
jgi:hypothetical protein